MPPKQSAVDVTKRPLLASYDSYLDAQKAVDTLSDKGFPVRNVAIVGVDLRIVESVLGRLSWGRAAFSGLATGAWFGMLVMLLISLFTSGDNNTVVLVLLGAVYGAAAGIVFGLVSYGLTGGKRDFVSNSQLVAARYDVLCDAAVIGDARAALGLGGSWPPPIPQTPATAPSVAESATDSAGPGGATEATGTNESSTA